MAWSNKTKVPQSVDDGPITTPDGFDILVGELEDLILLWQEGFSNWVQRAKNAAGDWGFKNKSYDYLLTPDGLQLRVGSLRDQIVILRSGSSAWTLKTKTPAP